MEEGGSQEDGGSADDIIDDGRERLVTPVSVVP